MHKLKTVHPADAVISLEYYDINDSVDVHINLDNFLYEAYMGFYTTTVWRIYDLEEENVFDEFMPGMNLIMGPLRSCRGQLTQSVQLLTIQALTMAKGSVPRGWKSTVTIILQAESK